MRRFVSAEDIVGTVLELRARFEAPRSPDHTDFLELGCFVDSSPREGAEEWGRALKVELERLVWGTRQRVSREAWACWVLIRVRRCSRAEAARTYNEAVGGSGAPELCISGDTARRRSHEVDAELERLAASRGWMKYDGTQGE